MVAEPGSCEINTACDFGILLRFCTSVGARVVRLPGKPRPQESLSSRSLSCVFSPSARLTEGLLCMLTSALAACSVLSLSLSLRAQRKPLCESQEITIVFPPGQSGAGSEMFTHPGSWGSTSAKECDPMLLRSAPSVCEHHWTTTTTTVVVIVIRP